MKENGDYDVYYRNIYTSDFIFGKKIINEYACDADVVIMCVGDDKTRVSESFDRKSLKISPLQEELIGYVSNINENLIVVVYGGGAIDMSSWIDKAKCVLFAGFAGEGVNEALAAIITGKCIPSGKLTETFPLCLEDTPTKSNVGNGYYERYDEGVFVGYRYYDEKNLNVLFPFGFGLSYAEFEYSDLEITKIDETTYEVAYNIKNKSDFDAKEVSQVYVSDLASSVSRPKKELKGFAKTLIKAGETVRVSVKLDYRSFAFYSLPLKRWYVENGKFKISVGSSSRDILLQKTIEINLPTTTQQSYQK